MKTRIVQITDIHLTEAPGSELYGVDTGAALTKVIAAIHQLEEQPELIVVTGDLVEEGTQASYQRVQSSLATLDLPVYVLPGNHDHSHTMHKVLTDNFISYVRSTTVGKWVCVFVDSQVEGQAHGLVTASDLSRLQQTFNNDINRPVLVALHHTPSGVCPSAGCQLQNADAFTRLLNEHSNVKAVIAGHTHTEFEVNAGSHMQFTTPSTFAQARHAQRGESEDHDDFWASHTLDGKRQGFRVLDLYDEGRIATQVHWVGE
ncbi:MAG: metallophosphoesterase [Pseudomonadota bacterium]